MLPADRDAENQVAHQIDHGVVSEIVLRTEKTRTVAEVDFPTEHAGPHASGAYTEPTASVRYVAPEIHARPRVHVSVGTSGTRSAHKRCGRREHQRFDKTSHHICSSLAVEAPPET